MVESAGVGDGESVMTLPSSSGKNQFFLMRFARPRRHVQHPIDDLVALPVVRQLVEHVDGPFDGRGWHAHTLFRLARGEQGGVAHRTCTSPTLRYRSTATRHRSTPPYECLYDAPCQRDADVCSDRYFDARLNTAPCGIAAAFPPCGHVTPAIRIPGSALPAARNRSSSVSLPVASSKRAISTRFAIAA